METPEEVKEYCKSFTFCRGCKFECKAPHSSNYDIFLKWHDEQCIKIMDHINKKGE